MSAPTATRRPSTFWTELKALGMPVVTYWGIIGVSLGLFTASLSLTTGILLDPMGWQLIVGLWFTTYFSVIVGQVCAILRLRFWVAWVTGTVIWSLILAAIFGLAVGAAPTLQVLGVPLGLLWFFFPMFMPAGLFSLRVHMGYFAAWVPVVYLMGTVITLAEWSGWVRYWHDGSKFAFWNYLTAPILLIGVVMIIGYLASRERHRIHRWQYSEYGPDIPMQERKVGSVIRALFPGCGTLILLGGLSVILTADAGLIAPYLFRTGPRDGEHGGSGQGDPNGSEQGSGEQGGGEQGGQGGSSGGQGGSSGGQGGSQGGSSGGQGGSQGGSSGGQGGSSGGQGGSSGGQGGSSGGQGGSQGGSSGGQGGSQGGSSGGQGGSSGGQGGSQGGSSGGQGGSSGQGGSQGGSSGGQGGSSGGQGGSQGGSSGGQGGSSGQGGSQGGSSGGQGGSSGGQGGSQGGSSGGQGGSSGQGGSQGGSSGGQGGSSGGQGGSQGGSSGGQGGSQGGSSGGQGGSSGGQGGSSGGQGGGSGGQNAEQPPEGPTISPKQVEEVTKSVGISLGFLLLLLVLALLCMLVFGPPVRRTLLLRHLRVPFWPVEPTRRVQYSWRIVEIALADLGVERRPGDSASTLAQRARDQLPDELNADDLTYCANLVDRVIYGYGMSSDDTERARRTAEMAYQAVWSNLTEWAKVLAVYRAL